MLHWFTGTKGEANRAVEAGCYFSINHEMLKKEAHRTTIRDTIPINRLLTETDGPFVEMDERPVRPRDVATTVDELALLLGFQANELRAQIVDNLRTLLERPD